MFTSAEMLNSAISGSYVPIHDFWVRKLSLLMKEKKCLELFSGKGLLATRLRELGVDLIATDDYSWSICGSSVKLKRWTREKWIQNFGHWRHAPGVEKLDCLDAVKKYGSTCDVVLMVYPPSGPQAANVCRTLLEKKLNPKIIFIGNNGNCADSSFFSLISKEATIFKFNGIEGALASLTW